MAALTWLATAGLAQCPVASCEPNCGTLSASHHMMWSAGTFTATTTGARLGPSPCRPQQQLMRHCTSHVCVDLAVASRVCAHVCNITRSGHYLAECSQPLLPPTRHRAGTSTWPASAGMGTRLRRRSASLCASAGVAVCFAALPQPPSTLWCPVKSATHHRPAAPACCLGCLATRAATPLSPWHCQWPVVSAKPRHCHRRGWVHWLPRRYVCTAGASVCHHL